MERRPEDVAAEPHRLAASSEGWALPVASIEQVTGALQDRRARQQPIRFTLAEGASADDVAGWLFDAMVDDARSQGAPGLDLEPYCGAYAVRTRIDGRQQTLSILSAPISAAVRAILAPSADLGERTVARTIGDTREFMSVSALDCAEGRRIHIEFKAAATAPRMIALGGASHGTRQRLSRLLDRAEGVILVGGLPGSGRHSTITAMLQHMASRGRSVLALGDRPSAPIAGLGHVPVTEPGASGIAEMLRAAARHQPDAIAFDGIADRALMELALQSAQPQPMTIARTDAADAIGAILQLRALRIDPFLIAGSLRAVMAQRLVRRLCPECRFPVQAAPSVSALLGFDPGAIVYQGAGCDACGGTGFQGFIAAFELVEVDHAIRRLIADGGDESILARHAFLKTPNLGSAARALVREGATSAEEAVRLSRGTPIAA
ncbi:MULTISPECIES: ATPase, T2SS/T4P/T4SS family [unclassified Sphingomonas]|uniref:ATPase, T2SS/T4P/T4SS family n=1 Tax=unclassified Sphingomonas TaxID=196159 RepID=UPI00082B3F00|nr:MULTISPECIES: ATPase, T2SS/T4P/T4SS family [unclassified Sphingomonas]